MGDLQHLCIVLPYPPSPTETFIRAHMERLATATVVVEGWRGRIDGRMVLPFHSLALHRIRRMVFRTGLQQEQTDTYLKVFRDYSPAAVLAEYGDCGAQVADACRIAGLPLIVHFHGYDASEGSGSRRLHDLYAGMFRSAAAVIGVSRPMMAALEELGAPRERLHYVPYGVDQARFEGAAPGSAGPVFLSAGRFVEKKAPLHTIEAFRRVHEILPDARLRMIGEGPLLEASRAYVAEQGLGDAVTFLGSQSHDAVAREMRSARCFVQHSVVAASGDSEGTPVAILEAGMSGLPVVSTTHAGIPDVIIEGETGFLVAEHDVAGMSACMLKLAQDPGLAQTMGARAREHIAANYSMERRLDQLRSIIVACIENARRARER